jgi:PAS domain S-box-containing protein
MQAGSVHFRMIPLVAFWAAFAAHTAHAQQIALPRSVAPAGLISQHVRYLTTLGLGTLCLALLAGTWIVSARKESGRRTRALAASKSRYERIFAESPAANFVSTPKGELLACNANYASLLGYESIEAACAMPTQSLYTDPRVRVAMLDALRRDGRLMGQEYQLQRVDGSLAHVQENVVGHFDEHGELTELHGFMLDLTAQRQAEAELRQAQKMEAIGRLAGGIAHDFNNLLTIILGSSDLALESLQADHEARADIDEVRGAARRAVELTAQLLSFSRRQVLKERVVDVATIVSGIGSMVRRLVSADVAIAVALPPQAQQPVLVDPHQLEQALLNLAVNASDAMPQGGVLEFSVEEVTLDEAWVAANGGASPGRYCRVQVRDSGCGMDPVTRAKAFEPFFTTKPVGKGTGLGLSMVFGFIKQSGGYVTIDSAPQKGTTVSLYLPVALVIEPVLPALRDTPASSRPAQRGSGTVLIVEDDPRVRALAARIIASAGFETLVAESACEATALARTVGSLALVLTDIVMPNGGGLEVAESLRVLFPGVPLIFMSGYTEDAEVLRGVRTAQHAFIGKPFSPESLAAAVLARARSVPAAAEHDPLYAGA